MHPNNYYRNSHTNIPPYQHFIPPLIQYPPYYPYFANYRFPPVDNSLFMTSAKSMQGLMTSANTIIAKLATSSKYSSDVMTAAQFSKMSDVYELIESLGIKDKPQISFTPDGINIQFDKSIDNVDLCHLTVKIRWG